MIRLPPPASPPSDEQLRNAIYECCDRIIKLGEEEEDRFLTNVFLCLFILKQELPKSFDSFAYLGLGCDYYCFHLACLRNHISMDEERRMV